MLDSRKGNTNHFWEEIVAYSNYILNKVLNRVVLDLTPLEKWSGMKLSFRHLKTFGHIALDYSPDEKWKKLDPRVNLAPWSTTLRSQIQSMV
jgi:hypothetical protein